MCDQRDDLGDNAEQIISPQFNEADITAIGMTEDNQAELVFSVWISHEDYFLSLLDTYVGEADASLRRVWVRPVRRRSGLATMGLSFAEYAAKEVGIPRLWSLIVHDNMASRRLHEKSPGGKACRLFLPLTIQVKQICEGFSLVTHSFQ